MPVGHMHDACGAHAHGAQAHSARAHRRRCRHASTCLHARAQARWVLDVTDHVWTEVWVPAWGRYVHADPCENVLDAPLMYEAGWGKKLSYIFAFGSGGAADVAPRYSTDWQACLERRTDVKEGWLELTIASLNASAQAGLVSGLTEEQRRSIEARAVADGSHLDALRLGVGGPVQGGDSVDKEAERRGRQTGSVEWREARGELGVENQGAQ